jgi:pimeloyl-ACP methyl ester carboxylesterase
VNYLLVRGLAREAAHWYDFPAALAARSGGRVERLDLAGVGTQRANLPLPSVPWLARDVARRWRELEAKTPSGRWVVVGLSLGGMVALELCRMLPGSFERAVIINASSRLTNVSERLSPRGVATLLRALASADALARERRVLALTSALPRDARSRYAEQAARIAAARPPSRFSVLAQLLGAARFVPPPPTAPSVPVCFVCSRHDRLVSPRCSRDLAAFYASPLLEHPWAGHDLPLDDPDWLCDRLVTDAAVTSHT